MIGRWNYTVWLTYISIILAVFGIGCAFANFDHNVDVSVICLLTCGLLDLFDGKVARTKKDRTDFDKEFGIQIDSLSDLVAFGVLPAAIGFAIGLDKWYFYIFLIMYVLFGLVRLGFFNSLEIERGKNMDTDIPTDVYIGMPITMASLIFPAFYIFNKEMGSAFKYVYFSVLVIVGILFVAKIKIPKANNKKVVIGLALFGLLLLIAMIVEKIIWYNMH